ncbi:MAG: LamB/YcsF family protein [Nitrospira sp.]|nr:LamB/YcsF family protein [Nitrospira sp.]MCP9442391.1 LamB/YcsF family protein [Nitrospira sp.]
MRTIDLNSDLGEYDSAEFLSREAELMPLLTSVNIACGAHAGHPTLMRRTARLAAEHGVAIGAHPGFPNKGDFGRGDRRASPDQVASLVIEQLTTLSQVLMEERLPLRHVKLHGALYHFVSWSHDAAESFVQTVAAFDRQLLIVAPAGSFLIASAERAGLGVVQEAFADRTYRADGTLVPRSDAAALLRTDQQVLRQLREILQGFVTSIDGLRVPLHADSLCIHADTPRSVDLARLIRAELESAGYRLAPPKRP